MNPVKVPEDRISIYLGQRNLDEDEWSPVDNQGMLGFEYVHEKMDSTVGIEVGLMGSSDDSTIAGQDVTVSTGELYVGFHKSWGEDVVRPFLGGGVSLIHLEANVRKALALARRLARKGDTVLVAGSLYLVGEVLSLSSPRKWSRASGRSQSAIPR